MLLAIVVMVPSLSASAVYYADDYYGYNNYYGSYYNDYGYGNNYNYYDNGYNYYGYDSFYDVPSSYPYYDSISWMKSNDVVSGYEGGYFRPDICVNRAEFLKMMFEIDGEDDYFDYPYYTTAHYSDVMPGDWFYPYVVKATYDGVVRGYTDGTFKPANCVTRAEAIKVASLYFNDGDLPEIDDYEFRIVDNDFRQWYFPFVDYASRSNVVGIYHAIPARSTYDDSYYYLPQESMTRGEVAEMLYRLEYITDRNDEIYEGGRRDGSSGSSNSNSVACEVDVRDSVYDPSEGNLRIDYEIGDYDDERVRVQLNLIYSNNDELELRDVSVDSDDDYTYYWDGEDEDDDRVSDGSYKMELKVRDRETGRTLCTDTESFRVDN